MFILGTICCRGGSKGVPGKNIKLLNAKPLIAYTIETAKKVSAINDLIVSTDNNDIATIAKQNGIEKILHRPNALAADDTSKWLVFRDVVEKYEKEFETTIDYIVDMDVTVPLKNAADISGAIALALENENADVVITAYEPERNPYFNMMEIKGNGFAGIVKKTSSPVTRRQDAPKVFSLSPAAYVIKRNALFEQSHWSLAKCLLYQMPRERAIDIDTIFDFKLIEFIIQHNGNE